MAGARRKPSSPRSEIRRVKEKKEDDLLKLEGVTGVDIDYKVTAGKPTEKLCIVVFVEKKKKDKDVPDGEAIPKTIGGIPTDVQEETFHPHGLAMPVADVEIKADTNTYDPLKGGISIGPCRSVFLEPPDVPTAGNYVFVGTLGCVVEDNSSGDKMLLSNFHVMCVDDGWNVGDLMAQPSRPDGGNCPADVVGALQRAVLDEDVDCAVSSHTDRSIVCEIEEIGDVRGKATATEDQPVRKRGRTTGLTYGKVISVDFSTNVNYGDGLGIISFKKQIRIQVDSTQSTQFGTNGDSGSVVVTDDGKVIGLYFAGNSSGSLGVANPIDKVLSKLDVKLCIKGIKKWEIKEFKEFKELEHKWHWKVESKEFKERWKEYAKDFKEWGYDKGWMEDKGLQEHKLVENKLDDGSPWDRIPGGPGGPGSPGGPGRPPIGRFGAGAPPSLSLEERLERLEQLVAERFKIPWPIRPRRSCSDFTSMAPGNGYPNPLTQGAHTFTTMDWNGAPKANNRIVNWGQHNGLDAGFTLDIRCQCRCRQVEITLVHFSQPATVTAYNTDGSVAGSATMSGPQNVAETLSISGSAIDHVQVTSPQNEVVVLRYCCERPWIAKRPDKPWFKELKEKELKEKEWKEGKEKELKEGKEPKEIYEGPGGKNPGFPPGNPGYPGSGPQGGSPGGAPSAGGGSPEERLARLEARLGQGGHFIPPELRPDLSHGALRREDDFGGCC